MGIGADAPAVELVHKHPGGGLPLIPGDHHAVDIQPIIPQVVDEAVHLQIIGDAVIIPDFIPLNIPCIHTDDNFRLVFQLLQQLDLGVFIIAGQHPLGMQVVHQLAAKLQIQLLAAVHPLQDKF